MGDAGDYWREAREHRRRPPSWQYRCECGVYVAKRKAACGYCERPNPDQQKRGKRITPEQENTDA